MQASDREDVEKTCLSNYSFPLNIALHRELLPVPVVPRNEIVTGDVFVSIYEKLITI